MEIKNNMNRLEPQLNPLKIEQGQEHSRPAEKAAAPVQAADTVQFKSPGLKAAIEQAAQQAPDLREERVAAIKAQLAEGSYKTDSKTIAAKLLKDERELLE